MYLKKCNIHMYNLLSKRYVLNFNIITDANLL